MLRAALLYLSVAGWARRFVTHFPLARRVARRFVAGETVEEALQAIRELNARGIAATVDHLGESVTAQDEAIRAVDDYLTLIDSLQASGVESWLSLKLTQLGLDLSEELCLSNLRRVLDRARQADMVVTIDMESSAYTGRILAVFHRLFGDEGYRNLRVVIQAYLYRSEADVAALVEGGAGVRLCKGAYDEPPTVAFPRKRDVDANYESLMKTLLDGTDRGYPGIATHDEKLIEAARRYVDASGIAPDRFEFQMLYGIRSELQARLAREGYGMRVYVPYGTEWYPYFVRRLAERPANLWFFVSNLAQR